MNEKTKILGLYIFSLIVFPYLFYYSITYLSSNGSIPVFSNEQINLVTNLIISIFLPVIMVFIVKKDIIDDTKKCGKNIAWIIPAIVFLYGASMLILQLVPLIDGVNTTDNQKLISQMQNTNFIATLLMVTVLLPIQEEITFRYAFLSKKSKSNVILPLIASSICFGLAHQLAGFSMGSLIAYTILGSILAFYYIKFENITINIMIHGGYNLLTYLLMYLKSQGIIKWMN